MKKMIFAALLAACIGCSNQEDVVMETGNKVSLSVKLNFSDAKTKSGDDAITDEANYPKWTQLLLITKDNTGHIVNETIKTKEDLGEGLLTLIESSVNRNLIGGTVEVYAVTEVGLENWGSLGSENLPVLASEQTDINNWQPSGFIKKDIKGTFANVPYYGSVVISLDGSIVNETHTKLLAKVDVNPELGRIQILGTPQSGGATKKEDESSESAVVVSAIKVTNVYINRITTKNELIDIREGKDVPTTGWADKFYGLDKLLSGMKDIFEAKSTTTNVGYQIFDQDKPHVIVKVTYQLNDDESKSYEGYLTIQKFNYTDADADQNLTVNKGKVYDIDLSKLQPKFDQITDEPYDKTVYYDLSVDVTVHDWVKVPVDPEL